MADHRITYTYEPDDAPVVIQLRRDRGRSTWDARALVADGTAEHGDTIEETGLHDTEVDALMVLCGRLAAELPR